MRAATLGAEEHSISGCAVMPGPPRTARLSGRDAQLLVQLGMHHQGGNLQSLGQVLSLLAGRKPYAKANLMQLSILTDLPLLKSVSQVSNPAEQLFALNPGEKNEQFHVFLDKHLF